MPAVSPLAPTSSARPRTLVRDLPKAAGQRVLVQGWLHHRRSLKAVDFLLLRDRSGIAQIVLEEPALRERIAALAHESVLSVVATARPTPATAAGIELIDAEIEVLVGSTDEPPLELWRPNLDAQLPTLLDHAAVSLCHPARGTVQRLLAAAVAGFRETLMGQDFVEIATPKLQESAPEGGANVFTVDYFGRPAYLAQSPQLYKQIMVGALERVFEVAPAFRAEPHDTSRHLSQYLSLDAEFGFIRDHHDVMAVVREVMAGIIAGIQAVPGAPEELPTVPDAIPVVHFRDTLALVGEALGEDLSAEPDLAPEHERWLGAWAEERFGSAWLFVEGYPMRKRPFYTHPQPSDPRWSNSFDLLFRGLEIVTGGQRLHQYDDYIRQIEERNMAAEPFAGYLEAFRTGMPPHGGFAIGIERLLKQLVDAGNIRDVMLFPRDLHRLAP